MQDSDATGRLEGRQRLCHRDAVGPAGTREVRLGGGDWPLRVIVVRNGGRYSAFRNRCPHAGTALNLKPHTFLNRDGSALVCNTHGALFDRDSGACLAGPCAGRALTAYAVEVDSDGVLWATLPAE